MFHPVLSTPTFEMYAQKITPQKRASRLSRLSKNLEYWCVPKMRWNIGTNQYNQWLTFIKVEPKVEQVFTINNLTDFGSNRASHSQIFSFRGKLF
jgi:hypothetical protein